MVRKILRIAPRASIGVTISRCSSVQLSAGTGATREAVSRMSSSPRMNVSPPHALCSSEGGIAAVDHKAVRGVIGRRLAHEIDGDAAEIRGLAVYLMSKASS